MKKIVLILTSSLLFFACRKEKKYIPVTPPPAPPLMLKDVIVPNLPSPYYHFEYDASGKISFVSFASDFNRYDVFYEAGRISEMTNNIIVNKDRLHYFYNNAGLVEAINYIDSNGVVYTRIDFFYDGQKLVKLERQRKVTEAMF